MNILSSPILPRQVGGNLERPEGVGAEYGLRPVTFKNVLASSGVLPIDSLIRF